MKARITVEFAHQREAAWLLEFGQSIRREDTDETSFSGIIFPNGSHGIRRTARLLAANEDVTVRRWRDQGGGRIRELEGYPTTDWETKSAHRPILRTAPMLHWCRSKHRDWIIARYRRRWPMQEWPPAWFAFEHYEYGIGAPASIEYAQR